MEETLTHPRDGLATVRFGSAKTYEIMTGVAARLREEIFYQVTASVRSSWGTGRLR